MNYKERIDNHDFMEPDHIARFLRNHRTGTDNFGRMVLSNIIRTYDNPKVLDAACGTCVNWETFKLLGTKCRYTGMDRTRKMLDHAQTLYDDQIDLQLGYVQDMPFQDGQMDIVIMRHILEHLGEGYEAAIKEGLRVASKELIVVFFVDPSDSDVDIIKESDPDQNGCTYFWNTYSWNKFVNFVSGLGVQIQKQYIVTPGAAAADTIVRLIK